MQRFTRRRFLGAAAAAAVVGGVGFERLPLALKKVLATDDDEEHRSLAQVEHVVIFMQENRSLDTYFGSLSGVRGFDDPQALRLPSGRSVFYQPDALNPDGYELPFHLDTTRTAPPASPT